MTQTETTPPPVALEPAAGDGEHAAVRLLLERAGEAVASERERAERAEAEVARLQALIGERDRAEQDRLLTSREASRILQVSSKTLNKWSDAGKPRALRTNGGHRRFRESEVRALLRDGACGSPS